MKRSKFLIPLLAVALLQGCTSSPSKTSSEQPLSKIEPTILRGTATIGAQTRLFTPCGSQTQFQLQISDEQYKSALSQTQKSYEPVYAEVIGYLTIPSQTGYNADYQAKLHVLRFNAIDSTHVEQCSSTTDNTMALGTEPNWKAAISHNQLLIQTGKAPVKAFDLTNKQISAEQRNYQFSNGQLKMKAIECQPKDSGTLYGWLASLTLGSDTYQGCAKLSNYDASSQYIGTYSAQSTTSDLSTSLTLNRDHSAETRYSYSNGEPSLVEQGFWQKLSDDKIQVIMTLHQQQYLVTERVFTVRGKMLFTDKEKVGNKLYPISQGGLSLFKESH
ncbi:hypothetical protein OAP63_10795 [Vibrio sp.]|nr:hypothetical protein [Vibrio sp.]